MARVNMDDELSQKAGFQKLLILLGDVEKAYGAVYRADRVAQDYWFPERRPIPKEVWEEEQLNPALIEAGLARETDVGFIVHDAEKKFAWLFQKSAAGSAPKKPRKPVGHDDQPGLDLGASEENRELSGDDHPKSPDNVRQPPTPPLPPSPSSVSTSSSVSSGSQGDPPPRKVDGEIQSPSQTFLAAYCEAFKQRYGSNPTIDGQSAGIAKQLVDGKKTRIPIGRACDLVRAYLQMSVPIYLTRRHPLGLFKADLQAVSVFLDTGEVTTMQQANEQARRDGNDDVFKRYLTKTQGRFDNAR